MSVLRIAALVCLLLVIGRPLLAADTLSLPQVAEDATQYLAGLRAQFGSPDPTKSAAALKEALAKQGRNDAAGAVASYERAVGLGDERPETLLALSQALAQTGRLQSAGSAAWLAYLDSAQSDEIVKKSLLGLGAMLERQGRLREALEVYQGLNNVTYDEFAAGRINALREATDFRVVATTTSAGGDSPQACLEFRRPPSSDKAVDLADYVKVEPKVTPILSLSGSKLCIGGLDYGSSYKIAVLKGLPGAKPEDKLAASDTIAVNIGDRDPSVGFRSATYVLPRSGPLGVPVTTVNVDRLKLRLLRIGDRNIIRQMQTQRFLLGLDRYEADQIVEQTGEELWHGEMDVVVEPNKRVVTSVPIDQFLKATTPGIYLLTAVSSTQPDNDYSSLATQWLVVTDIGLTTMSGSDGLHAFARSLDSGKPIAGLDLRLYGINNEEFGAATTDANGMAAFAPGLLRGSAGKAPAAVMAFSAAGDYTLLDLTRAAFDLSDRGVGGRPAPGVNDLYFYTDRGVYRPGETVHLVGLLRDDAGHAIDNLPLTLRLNRPDNVQAKELVVTSAGAGSYQADLPMTPTAQTGTWTVAGYVDPAGQPVATASFLVEEVVPARIEVKLKSDLPMLKAGESASIDVAADYLYGAPAGGLPVGGDVTIRLDDDPFPAFPGYRFGLADEKIEPVRTEIAAGETDQDGKTSVAVVADNLPDTPQPLQAVVRTEVFEFGGRPVVQTLKLPVRNRPVYLGIKPSFANDSVADNSEAGFEVIAVDGGGTTVALPKAKYRLVREEWDYQWYYRNSAWDYEVVVRDAGSSDGEVAIAADKPAHVADHVQYGAYRLEVYDPASGAATSYRFYAGWAAAPGLGDTPDRLQVTADKRSYRIGESAKVLIKPPFAGEVLLTVATNKIVETRTLTVTAEGTVVDLPIDGAWGAGAYMLATAFRPATGADKRGPGRAIGLAWLGIDPAERQFLQVAIKAPEAIEPRHAVDIPIEVGGLTAGQSAFVTLAAVDEGVLQLTDFATPAPQTYFFGKRRLGVELRDLYGQLIDGRLGRRGEIRTGGDEATLGRRGAPPQIKLVALFSGVVKLDEAGRASVKLDVPDYNGRLRLMAVAWDKDKVGAAEFGMIVRDPVVALVALPRFLAPGDRSQAAVTLQNVSGPTGIYHLTLAAEGSLAVGDGAELSKRLEANQTATLTVPLLGRNAGEGSVILKLDGPGGFAVDRRVALTVRPAQLPTVQRLVRKLDPGEGLTLSGAALDGFLAGTGELMARFSDKPALDVPGLLKTLERYPYGCIEQTVSRAMPLLYVGDVAQAWGVANDPAASPDAMQRTIARVMEMQRYDGSFGLWSAHDETEPWLTSFAMDFLTRAQERGLKVSSTAYANGLKWLVGHSQSYRDDTPAQLASRAYAFYVLAKARSGDLGALRYLFDNYGYRVPSGLADAQMGAAFALYGDQPRAAAAFKLALDRVERRNYQADDYGSLTRDLAAIATLMLETKGSGQNPAGVLQRVAALQAQDNWLSTQEETWLLLAAHAAVGGGGEGGMVLTVGGGPQQTLTQPLYLRPAGDDLARGVTVRNAGANPVYSGETLIGSPSRDLPAAGAGFTLSRQFFTLDGTASKLDKVRQSDVFVVLLRGKMQGDTKRRVMLIDLLPAGFEVENARLAGSRSSEQLGWLTELTKTRYSEYLDDRFVAALDLDGNNREFAVAYMVRAVTPGTYRQPAAHVEDMYDPATRARTAIGSVTVRPFK